jgi:PKHD-type hydroxylase
MNLEYYYWYFKSALPKRLCDEIIQYGNSQRTRMALTGGATEPDEVSDVEKKKIENKRKSNVAWLDENWIYKEIQPYVHQANQNANWNFDWDFSEKAQFTKYGEGQFYGWHSDSYAKPYEGEKGDNLKGKIRKLSMTVSLNDPSEYEGGNLEFDFRNRTDYEFTKSSKNLCTEIRPQGSVIVFPSFVWHRVTPVTKGTRYSLVLWSCGPPFK